MKKLLSIGLLGITCLVGRAQVSTTNIPISDTFLNSVQGYFTSFSTNTWTGTKGYLESGAVYQKDINFGMQMELGIDIKDINTNLSLYATAKALNALGLGGVQSSDVGLKLGYRIHDTQLFVGLNGGYNYYQKSGEGAFSFGVQKKLTANTFAYTAFEPTFVGRSVKDYLVLGVGFTF